MIVLKKKKSFTLSEGHCKTILKKDHTSLMHCGKDDQCNQLVQSFW